MLCVCDQGLDNRGEQENAASPASDAQGSGEEIHRGTCPYQKLSWPTINEGVVRCVHDQILGRGRPSMGN
jgi:hypothetical protein